MRDFLLPLVALGLLAGGCGKGVRNPEPRIVGKWRVENEPPREISTPLFQPTTPVVRSPAIRDMGLKMSLEFKTDKTYTLITESAGRPIRAQGIYALHGLTATMTTTSLNGVDRKYLRQGESTEDSKGVKTSNEGPLQDWTATLDEDSTRLTFNGFGPEITFVRAN